MTKIRTIKISPAANVKMYVWETSIDKAGMPMWTLANDPHFFIVEDFFGDGYIAHNKHTGEYEYFETLEDAKASIKMDFHIHNINR